MIGLKSSNNLSWLNILIKIGGLLDYIICGVHFDRASRTKKICDLRNFSLLNMDNPLKKQLTFEGMKNCNRAKTAQKIKEPFKFN